MVLDITFDLETCALCPTAAVMSIAAVAWHRTADATPFIGDERFSFRANIDLKSAFVDGFTFDADTARWWRRQSEEAKRHLFASGKQEHLRDAVERFIQWIVTTARLTGADEVCLWAQGADYDPAILRYVCDRYGIDFNKAAHIPYTHVRDHRTFFLEGAYLLCQSMGVEYREADAYDLVDRYEGAGGPHDPVYDCKRSIYSTWQMMKHLRCLNINLKV